MNPEIMDVVNNIMTWISLIISCATLITLLASVAKILAKPNKTQDARLDELEQWRKVVDDRLDTGNTHFDEIDKGNRVTQEAILALMSHAINGNDIQKLKDAKDKLETYLIAK